MNSAMCTSPPYLTVKEICLYLTFAFIEEAAGLKERHVLSNLFGACR